MDYLITLSWHSANRSLLCPNNGENLVRKRQVSIFMSLVWLNQSSKVRILRSTKTGDGRSTYCACTLWLILVGFIRIGNRIGDWVRYQVMVLAAWSHQTCDMWQCQSWYDLSCCLLLWYIISILFQLYHAGDMIYEKEKAGAYTFTDSMDL